MGTRQDRAPSHLRSLKALRTHIAASPLGKIDAKEWRGQWSEGWVVYADLIGFADRAERSNTVILNNIVRFDRATQLVAEQFTKVQVRRFSDATFAVSQDFHGALSFAIALTHSCLAFNHEYLERKTNRTKPFFIHMIVPRVTLACGQILLLPEAPPDEVRFAGIEPRNVIAGSAIVRAYQLEKYSAGGLITLDQHGLKELRGVRIRGDKRVYRGLQRWVQKLSDAETLVEGKTIFYRGNVLDLPWLLFQPGQTDDNALWASSPQGAEDAMRAYFDIWNTSIHEFYSPQGHATPLEVAKHYQAAIRHGIQSHQLSRGQFKPRHQSLEHVLEMLS